MRIMEDERVLVDVKSEFVKVAVKSSVFLGDLYSISFTTKLRSDVDEELMFVYEIVSEVFDLEISLHEFKAKVLVWDAKEHDTYLQVSTWK